MICLSGQLPTESNISEHSHNRTSHADFKPHEPQWTSKNDQADIAWFKSYKRSVQKMYFLHNLCICIPFGFFGCGKILNEFLAQKRGNILETCKCTDLYILYFQNHPPLKVDAMFSTNSPVYPEKRSQKVNRTGFSLVKRCFLIQK